MESTPPDTMDPGLRRDDDLWIIATPRKRGLCERRRAAENYAYPGGGRGPVGKVLPYFSDSPNWAPAFAGVQKKDFRRGLALAGVHTRYRQAKRATTACIGSRLLNQGRYRRRPPPPAMRIAFCLP